MAQVRHVIGDGRIFELLEGRLPARALSVQFPPRARALVTVVIPCYNYGRYLAMCVGSVLAQQGVDLEIIIVDDASPDGSIEMARALASQDVRISVVAHERNLGHIATYNDGLSRAAGDYLVLLSADDALSPGSLGHAVAVLEAEPTIGFTYGRALEFSERLPQGSWPAATYKMWQGDDWLERRCARITNCIFSPEVVMRRAVFDRVGPYSPELPHTGDLAMWLKAAAISNVGYIEGPPVAFYRRHDSNMHEAIFQSGAVDGMLIDLEQRRLTFEMAFSDGDGSLGGEHGLRAVAMRNLASEALAAAGRAFTWGLTGEWPVSDLIRFAQRTWPAFTTLPRWRALRLRQALGPRISYKNPVFIAAELAGTWKREQLTRIEQRTGA